MHKIILFLFIFLGCSSKYQIKNDVRFNYHKRLFQEYSVRYGNHFISVKDMSIQFGDMPNKHTVGYCQTTSPRHIVIDREYWERCPTNEKETLILHELGHCVLDRDHTEKPQKGTCPDSIMNPSNIPSECYEILKTKYLKELFNE